MLLNKISIRFSEVISADFRMNFIKKEFLKKIKKIFENSKEENMYRRISDRISEEGIPDVMLGEWGKK